MEITWYGHACFRLKDRNATIITDPYDKSLGLTLPRLTADIVTISHNSAHHNYTKAIKGDFKVVDGPGEYEIKDTFITGIHLIQQKKENKPRKRNNLFVFYMDDITICHLGDLNHIPTQNQVENMGNIDVLMVPVGGQQALNAAQAAEVISLIEPYIVIPMHYKLPDLAVTLEPVEKFLKEMGITPPTPEPVLKLVQSGLPEETQIVLLEPNQ